jgi:hypothetical protein
MPELRFRLALTVKDLGAAFRLRDQTGMAVAYVYYEDRPEWQLGCPHLTEDEAGRIATNIANLAALLRR